MQDPKAAGGKAWKLDSSASGAAGKHDAPPEFGLYEGRTKALVRTAIAREDVPRDEDYHLLLVGRTMATMETYFWAHASWRLSQRLVAMYDSSLPEQKSWDVWASIKLEGPSYVPGSAKPDSFSIDRLILVQVP